jgi:hypothetical protein
MVYLRSSIGVRGRTALGRAHSDSFRGVLQNEYWPVYHTPFPHILKLRVFTESFYNCLDNAVRELVSRCLSERPDRNRLSRSIPGYDAYCAAVPPRSCFQIFFSNLWRELLSRPFGAPVTQQVSCYIHHHPAGSANGSVHNDLNPGPEAPNSGRGESQLLRAPLESQTVRTIAMIYYVGNEPWAPGYGGATGLYFGQNDAVDDPAKVVPPINNCLLVFECTPKSFHSFISNKVQPRNCIVLWLHRPRADAVLRWGEKAIVKWPSRL